MTQEPTSIVEVIEIVPPEDVPIVAARVAERLAMPVERVQKLIDARVGPITRPLRPDKAEAIAQTFEAAGVIVAIRPATPDDEVFAAAPSPDADQRESTDDDDRAGADVDTDDDAQAEAAEAEATEARRHEAEAGDTAYGEGADTDAEYHHAEHAEPEDGDPDASAELDEAEERAARARSAHDAGPFGSPPRERDPEPADLPGDEPAPEPAEAPGHEPDPEPADAPGDEEWGDEPPVEDPEEPAARAVGDEARQASAPARSRFAATPRPPATLRIEPEDDDEEDGPDDDGLEVRGEIPPRRRSLVVEVGDDPSQRVGPAFTDEDSWGGDDDRGTAWPVPRRGLTGGAADDTPRHETLSGAEPEPILVDDAADAADADAGRTPRRISVPPIGRIGRRRAEPEPEQEAAAEAEHDHEGGERRHDDDDWDDLDEDDDGERAEDERARPVPVAWRGLGDEASGPARPLDANIPRRLDPEEEQAELDAQRTTLRRTIMLWALVIAVALFAATQFWASGNASTGYDQGLHRFRDAQFASARQVWSRLAATGDANAQFMLGYMSETGMGQSWSARAAASWYRLAADQGHGEAQWRLGSLYDRGLGVPWSPVDAQRWWAAAAEGGHAEAAFTLGRSVFTASRNASDLARAGAAFERAMTLGWPDAAAYHRLLSDVSGATNESALR